MNSHSSDAQSASSRHRSSQSSSARRWGIILAGGDGTRLRRLTRFLYGDERPKQFCHLLGDETLLQQTSRRLMSSVDSQQTLYSLSRAHEPFYRRDRDIRFALRVVQPRNRGTAPAIVTALLQIAQRDPGAIVSVLPCDHYYSSEIAFSSALESAFRAAEGNKESVVLLGAQPSGPETDYGWIETGVRPGGLRSDVLQVNGFHEKPQPPAAERLFRSGSLWNTFVMVGHVNAFLEMTSRLVPELLHHLRANAGASRSEEIVIPDAVYDRIPAVDFSRQVLTPGAANLRAISLGNLDWSDLGDAGRVVSTLINGSLPESKWLPRWLAMGHAMSEVHRYPAVVLCHDTKRIGRLR